MKTNRLDRYLRKLEALPSFSPVISKVITLAVEEGDARQMAGIIEKDAALSAKILRVVNSPFFGLSRNISTLSRAVAILGLKVVKNLVLSLSLLKTFSGKNKEGFDFDLFWEHSITVAAGARLISEKSGYKDPEEGFIAGLLHDIGILIFASLEPREYKKVLDEVAERTKQNREYSITEMENRIMGITHPEIGGWLMRKWNLPEVLELAVKYHHETEFPAEVGPAVAKLVKSVFLADNMWNMFYNPEKKDEVIRFRQLGREVLNLADEDIKEVITNVTREAETAAGIFLKGPSRSSSYLEILERANLELGKINLSYLFMSEMIQGAGGEAEESSPQI